jgi:hypothetical protein
MDTPKCDWCDAELPDWTANIMVNTEVYFKQRTVGRLQVVCKPCTRKLYEQGKSSEWHNLWELRWVRDNLLHLLRGVLGSRTKGAEIRWSDQAILDFCRLAELRLPELAVDPLTMAMDKAEGRE